MLDNEKKSPFQPEMPVSPEKFEGREEIIEKNLPFIYQSLQGHPTHFFIKGKRGMGKTSLADYFKNMAEIKYKMLTVHVFNDGVHNMDSLIQQIVERLLNEINRETWAEKILKTFKKHVKSVEFFSTKIEFHPDDETMKFLKDNFPFFLEEIIDKINHEKEGLFIIIDDINGLSETPEFANWYKSFADTISTGIIELPLVMLLTTYPENAQKLYNFNPSFNRLFKHIEVKGLRYFEVEDFFNKIFRHMGMNVEKEAMDLMVRFSSGLPNMMQEIGDGVFWSNNDNTISKDDALKGIIRSGEEIGVKYLQPALDKSIRSENYLNIFRALGNDFKEHDLTVEYTFRKKDFANKLTDKENKAFSKFLSRAKELKIIEYAEGYKSGVYTFTNNLYPIYFLIQYLEYENNLNKVN
jgi:Cdc6-like AAA superfamily ATPase